jgi:hypothetical protein
VATTTANQFTYPNQFAKPSIFRPQQTMPIARMAQPQQLIRPQQPMQQQQQPSATQTMNAQPPGLRPPNPQLMRTGGTGDASYIWKPGTTKGPVFLAPDSEDRGGVPTITLADGRRVQGRYYNTNEGRHQYVFPQDVLGQEGATLSYNGFTQQIGNTNQSYEGHGGSPWDPRGKGSVGGGGGAGGYPALSGAAGGGSSGLGALPFDLSGSYPQFQPIAFPTIQPANYNFTDPTEFGNNFAQNNRGQFATNFGQAQDFSLQALQTELQGLQNFVPGAANLSRGQTAADNASNQAARTGQVNSVLPDAAGTFSRLGNTLTDQAGRAATYAQGRLPNDLLDRALELGIRSRAADQAGFSGIGPNSEQAAKVSDLMSADQRFQIAQYGENLLGQNTGEQQGLLQNRANLFLAPTEYSQVGSQIRPTPEVGAGRLTYQGAGMLNESTLLSPGQALQTQVQQQQFKTGLEQSTNEFNAQGLFNAAQYNSSGQFAADLGLFNYQVGVASQVQGVNQANLNGAVQAQTGGFAAGQYDAGITNGQSAQTIQSAAAGLGIAPSAVNAITGALTPSAPSTTTAPQSGSAQVGGPVGGSQGLSTTPVQAGGNASFPGAPQTTSTSPSGAGQTAPISTISRGVDASVPQAVKFSDGVPPPAGYQSIGSNGNGTYTAVPASDYRSDLDRFAKFGGVPQGSISVGNAAVADKNISNATGLSYVPLPQLQQVAMSGSGKPVFSTPAAASNGNAGLGAQNVNGLAITAATLGALTPENVGSVGDAVRTASGATTAQTISDLNELHSEQGPEAVTKAILDKLGGKVSADSAAGQQLVAGASRIGELWGGLSPAQKSLAISSMASAHITNKTGEHLGDKLVPGSDKTVGGPLKVGDAAALTGQGLNGHALARNWGQLSALGAAAGVDTRDKAGLAKTLDSIGMLGFGPQGAAVPVDAQRLQRVGAQPAPEFGVGAALFENKGDLPQHYVPVSKTPDGRTIGIPENLAHTVSLSGALQPLTYQQARTIARGDHPAQKNWGPPPARGLVRGSVGGSAIVSGLGLMSKHNPTLLSATIAHSLYNETLGGDGAEG